MRARIRTEARNALAHVDTCDISHTHCNVLYLYYEDRLEYGGGFHQVSGWHVRMSGSLDLRGGGSKRGSLTPRSGEIRARVRCMHVCAVHWTLGFRLSQLTTPESG